MLGKALVHAVDLGKLHTGVEDHFLDLRFSQILSGIGADIGQAIPLVHTKLAHANLHVEPVVVVLGDATLGKCITQHFLMDSFAALDLRDKSSSCLGERACRGTKEILPPFMLSVVGARRPSTSSNSDEHADFATRPLTGNRFLENLWCRVVGSRSFIDKHMLANLNRLESKSRG
jgi:hypothetical protein